MSIFSVPAAPAAPIAPRPDFADRYPSCPFHYWDPTAPRTITPIPDFPGWTPPGDDAETADQLAWENDRGDFTGDYPGTGWDDPDGGPAGVEVDGEPEPTPDDLAALHGANHDQQPDPEDVYANTISDIDYQDFENHDWFDRTTGAAYHEAEMAECGYNPYGIRLAPAGAVDTYAGGDWR